MKKLKIYFDMDGVLANFDKAVNEMRHLDEVPWIHIPNFFRNLEPIGQPNITIAELQNRGYEVYILTKVEIRDTPARAEDKKAWLQKYIPNMSLANTIIVPGHLSKLDYIRSNIEDSVLIDDYKGNLIEWQQKGGIAVKFGNKVKVRPYFQITNDIHNIVKLLEEIEEM